MGLLVLVILPRPHLKCVVAAGDITKGLKCKLISFLKYLFNGLHKEKTAPSIKIEAVNSNIALIIYKD